MKKLTKEQADWFREKLVKYEENYGYDDIDYNNLDLHVKARHLDAIFAECTEKPFPVHVPNYAPLWVTYKENNGENFIAISVLDDGFANCIKYVTAKEFKEFVDGCNKIVEWLDNESR